MQGSSEIDQKLLGEENFVFVRFPRNPQCCRGFCTSNKLCLGRDDAGTEVATKKGTSSAIHNAPSPL